MRKEDILKNRFYTALKTYKKHFRNSRHRMTGGEKKREIDFAHLVRHVQTHGFKWFPDLYVIDEIDKMEAIVAKLNS